MPLSFGEQRKKWIEKQKQRVAAKQIEMAEYAMEVLFEESPHTDDALFAEGVYDASHKISINGSPVGGPEGPTGSRVGSHAIIKAEKAKAKMIEAGDTVTIKNTSGHTADVEYGAPTAKTWKKEGYHPFAKALDRIKRKYGNVLK